MTEDRSEAIAELISVSSNRPTARRHVSALERHSELNGPLTGRLPKIQIAMQTWRIFGAAASRTTCTISIPVALTITTTSVDRLTIFFKRSHGLDVGERAEFLVHGDFSGTTHESSPPILL
jgi:hypothetical protein